MSENEPKAATLQEIKACCPGADSDFIVAQMEGNATKETASRAWMAELQQRAEAEAKSRKEAEEAKAKAEQEAAEAKAEAEKAKAGKPGVEALGGGKEKVESGDAIAEFTAAVKAKMDSGLTKQKATASVVREQPDLHAAYIQAVNA